VLLVAQRSSAAGVTPRPAIVRFKSRSLRHEGTLEDGEHAFGATRADSAFDLRGGQGLELPAPKPRRLFQPSSWWRAVRRALRAGSLL
jgi:hypothetical protein